MSRHDQLVELLDAEIADLEQRLLHHRDARAALTGDVDVQASTPKVERRPTERKPASTRKRKTRRPGPQPTVDYAEVARIANEARANGEPMAAAVAAHYDIPANAAKQRIAKARTHGHDVAHGIPGRPKPGPDVEQRTRAHDSTEPHERGTSTFVTPDDARALLEGGDDE